MAITLKGGIVRNVKLGVTIANGPPILTVNVLLIPDNVLVPLKFSGTAALESVLNYCANLQIFDVVAGLAGCPLTLNYDDVAKTYSFVALLTLGNGAS